MNLDSIKDNLPAAAPHAPALALDGARTTADASVDSTRPPDAGPEPAVEAVRAASDAITQALESASRNLRFEVDESSGRTVVQVVEASSGEVLRQMPSEEVLRIAAQLAAAGTLRSLGIDEAT